MLTQYGVANTKLLDLGYNERFFLNIMRCASFPWTQYGISGGIHGKLDD
jgi:hypothetical protein